MSYIFLKFIVLSFIFIHSTFSYAQAPDFISMDVSLNNKPNIGFDVEKSLQYLFHSLAKNDKTLAKPEVDALLTTVTSSISSGSVSIKDKNGKGAFLRETIHAPIEKVISFYFANNIPLEAIQPAGVRSIIPLRGSENIPQDDVEAFLNAGLSAPKAYIGYDREETTADLFTGASYIYPVKKMRILLPPYKGKRIAMIINKQMEPSSISTKAVTLGNDQNWNYIYSSLQGSTDASTGWVKSLIYDSAMVLVFVENVEEKTTEFFLFKWLRAGWLRINVVSSSHIYRGSKRVLYSINKVLSSDKLPSVQAVTQEYSKLKKMPESQLKALLEGYSAKLTKIALTNPILKTKEWLPFVSDGKYASTLRKNALVSLLMKNYIKEHIGVPIL